MGSFTTPLVVEHLGGRFWEIQQTFTYSVGHANSTEHIMVPQGFITNFAAVPWILCGLNPIVETYGKAVVVHDLLYATQSGSAGSGLLYTRKRADEIFLEGLKVLKVSAWKRRLIYCAARLFGSRAWISSAKAFGS